MIAALRTDQLGYEYAEETGNPAYHLFLSRSAEKNFPSGT
jgi:hypothetical protein